MDFSKIEAGKMEINVHEFSLARLLNDTLRLEEPKREWRHFRGGLTSSEGSDDESKLRKKCLRRKERIVTNPANAGRG